jgi:hypothetical protein
MKRFERERVCMQNDGIVFMSDLFKSTVNIRDYDVLDNRELTCTLTGERKVGSSRDLRDATGRGRKKRCKLKDAGKKLQSKNAKRFEILYVQSKTGEEIKRSFYTDKRCTEIVYALFLFEKFGGFIFKKARYVMRSYVVVFF